MWKPIIIREIPDGICGQGIGRTWRAYGLTETGNRFQLPDSRYAVLYPLDASTESEIRRLCARQYPNHPIIRGYAHT